MKKNADVFPVRLFAFFLISLLCLDRMFAQGVNREELERNQAAVDFINFDGPHAQVDTVEQIREIGYGLGLAVRNGAVQTGGDNRYFVIHSVSPADGGKLDSDIFGLGVDVGVDHIRNLRLIIQGYLEGAYNYNTGDAALLSRYATIYNAVFRGDWNFFNTRYKTPVVQNLNNEKAGLSIRFDEWPGQTLMTIPLGLGVPGSLSAVDTSALTAPEVTDQMRRDGGNIEDRKDMVDLKEREADEASQSATLKREAIDEEEKNLQSDRQDNADQRQRLEQEQQQARRQEEQAREDEAAGTITPEQAAQRQEEAQKKQEELAQQEKDIEKNEQEIARREQAQEDLRQSAAADEARAQQKAEEARREREEIAQDQQAQITGVPVASTGSNGAAPPPASVPAGAANPAAAANLLGINIISLNSPLGRLVKLNPNSGETVQTSPVNTINSRTLILSGGKILAIAGVNTGNGAIRLVEMSPDTLEMIKQGDDDIHPQSLLWINGTDLYAVIVSGGKNYLGRFNTALAKQGQSEIEVHPYASCVFQGDRILTQKADGSPLLVNTQTLK